MRINEIAGVDDFKKYKKGSYRLSGGITGKGGQIGDIIDMTKRHYDAWKKIVKDYPDYAKEKPAELLQAWHERFYGSSSAKISWKKATSEFGVKDTKKGANAILRTVIGIMLKPKSAVEMQAYLEQVVDKLPDPIGKEVSEDMPGPKSSGQPTAAQNQQGTQNKPPLAKGTKKQASDGQEYEWKGAQWVSTKTGRMATKQISAELGK